MRVVMLLAAIAFGAVPEQLIEAQSVSFAGTTLTLDDALRIALESNPSYLQTTDTRRTADAQIVAARGALLPTSNASFSTSLEQGGTEVFQGVPFATSGSASSSYSLGVSYSLNKPNLLRPEYQRMNRDATEADIRSNAAQLRSNVTQQYITVLEDEARAALQDSLRLTAVAQLELARARLEVGSGISTDVSSAAVTVGQSDVAIVTARNAIQLDLLRLFQFMGIDAPQGEVRLITVFPLSAPAFSRDSLISLAKANNPALAAQRTRATASDANVRIAKAQYLPSLSLSTGLGGSSFEYTNSNYLVNQAQASTLASQAGCYSSDSIRTRVGLTSLGCGNIVFTPAEASAIRASNAKFPFDFTHSPLGLSAGISVPVLTGYSTQTTIQEAQIARQDQAYAVRGQELQLTTDVTSAFLTLTAAYRTIQLQEQNSANARDALTSAEARWGVGSAAFLEVTTARGQFAQAEIDRVNAIYDYHKDFAALEFAVGHTLR